MRTIVTLRGQLFLWFLACIFSSGWAYHFVGRSPSGSTNEENVLNIPAVSRLLKCLEDFKNKVPSIAIISTNHDSKNTNTLTKLSNAKNTPLKSLLRYNQVFSKGKKGIHEMLHRFLNVHTGRHLRQDSQTLSKFSPRDDGGKSGNFKIADEEVKGKGIYSISPGQSDVEIKLTLKVNNKPQQHRKPQTSQLQPPIVPSPPPTPSPLPPTQHQPTPKPLSTSPLSLPQQPQQQQQNIKSTSPRPSIPTTTPKMCLVPCKNTTTPVANCVGSQFEYGALNIHNKYRAVHNAPPMTLNCEMSQNATAYAQKLADMDSFVSSGYNERPEQGENLSLGCYKDREQTAEEAIKVWFDEVCQYTFGKHGPQPGTSHFTQLVWKRSTEFGIGKAFNTQPNGATCTFIVARYNPQGNFENDDNAYVKNVEKGSFDERYCSYIKKPGLEGGYGLKRFRGN